MLLSWAVALGGWVGLSTRTASIEWDSWRLNSAVGAGDLVRQVRLNPKPDTSQIPSQIPVTATISGKTCDLDKFQQYVTKKLQINAEVAPLYQDTKFRQYKWYAYINKKRTEDTMVHKIVKKYSSDHKIIIGDWSIGKQMRNFISTPNLTSILD